MSTLGWMAATSSASGASPATTRSADFHRLQNDEGTEVRLAAARDQRAPPAMPATYLWDLPFLTSLCL